jgi:hypothetical protein
MVIDGTDREHQVLRGFDAVEWRAYCCQLCRCGELSSFCLTWPLCVGNLRPASVYTWIQCQWCIIGLSVYSRFAIKFPLMVGSSCSGYQSFGISKISYVEGFYLLRVQVL